MIDTLLIIGASVLGGAVTGAITVATLKNDVVWIKKLLDHLDQRVTMIEININERKKINE